MLNDSLFRVIKDKVLQGQDVSIFFCGRKYKNNYQENIVRDLLKLGVRNKNLHCYHLVTHLPLMCFSKNSGCIQILSKTELNLVSTKAGAVSSYLMLYDGDIQAIKNIESCLETGIESAKDKVVPMPDMHMLEKLWLDFDSVFMNKFGFSIFQDSGIKDKSDFISMSTTNNEQKYNEFLNILNKMIYESLTLNAKRETGDKNFFWNKFCPAYPKLYKNLDKIRVYRNKAHHTHLNANNENLYYKYLNEDSGGVFIEFIPNGYRHMQSSLLNDMQLCLRELISQ